MVWQRGSARRPVGTWLARERTCAWAWTTRAWALAVFFEALACCASASAMSLAQTPGARIRLLAVSIQTSYFLQQLHGTGRAQQAESSRGGDNVARVPTEGTSRARAQ